MHIWNDGELTMSYFKKKWWRLTSNDDWNNIEKPEKRVAI